MKHSLPYNEDSHQEVLAWIKHHVAIGDLRGTQFRAAFGNVYDFSGLTNLQRRELIDACSNKDALVAVLDTLLRPHHFGDTHSATTYLENIESLKKLRPLTSLQEFWVHRMALRFIISAHSAMSYARRSLGGVVAFSTTSIAALDALVLMTFDDAQSSALALAALDKWYGQQTDYLSARAIYQEPKTIRQAMLELEQQSSAATPVVILPDDML